MLDSEITFRWMSSKLYAITSMSANIFPIMRKQSFLSSIPIVGLYNEVTIVWINCSIWIKIPFSMKYCWILRSFYSFFCLNELSIFIRFIKAWILWTSKFEELLADKFYKSKWSTLLSIRYFINSKSDSEDKFARDIIVISCTLRSEEFKDSIMPSCPSRG